MRGLADPIDNKGTVRLKDALAMASHLAWSNRAGHTMTLRPLHNRGNRDAETRRYCPAALAGLNRRNDALPKINRKWSHHLMLASTPASILNLTRDLLGIPPIQSINETL
jgi:hypothetical protein